MPSVFEEWEILNSIPWRFLYLMDNQEISLAGIQNSPLDWRLNHLSRIGKGKEAITFDKKPTPFSYFAKTASVVVSDTTEHGVCETDVARMIRILNGFVVLDIFGLTLSRAVGLVIT